jgi:hypothetical protein
VAQGEGFEFKPQYCKTKQNKTDYVSLWWVPKEEGSVNNFVCLCMCVCVCVCVYSHAHVDWTQGPAYASILPLTYTAYPWFFETGSCCVDWSWPPSPYVAQAGLELTKLLPQPPECWDHRYIPSYPILFLINEKMTWYFFGGGKIQISESIVKCVLWEDTKRTKKKRI